MKSFIEPITSREYEVLQLLAHGYTSRELAQELFISIETVHSHRKNLNKKLGVRTTGGLIGKSFEIGLLSARFETKSDLQKN